ncbi:MAG: hypothetical protein ACYTF3_12625, partial [Planctomycetota bacterium]
FQAGHLEATSGEFHAAVREAPLVLVSDFHASERSRRGLATILAALPQDQPLHLVLELLPLGTTVTAQLAIAGGAPMLVTGERLEDAYADVLSLLAARKGTLVGAWADGSIGHRDRVIADLLRRMQHPGRPARVLFHGGDWHLAEAHLPRLLRERDLEPLVVHQSPEPLWEHRGLQRGPSHLKLDRPGHWAWMETPPLHLWASLLQDIRRGDEEEVAEGVAHLVGAAADCLAELLDVPAPEQELSFFPSRHWDEFHGQLPTPWSEAFSAEHPPRRDLFHPRRPWAWAPRPADLNFLTRAAAHLLLCSQGWIHDVSLQAELRRVSFRQAAARVANPFLRELGPRVEAEALFDDPDGARATALALRDIDPARLDEVATDPALLVLATRVWGSRSGHRLLEDAGFKPADLRDWLLQDQGDYDWRGLTATIRAANTPSS